MIKKDEKINSILFYSITAYVFIVFLIITCFNCLTADDFLIESEKSNLVHLSRIFSLTSIISGRYTGSVVWSLFHCLPKFLYNLSNAIEHMFFIFFCCYIVDKNFLKKKNIILLVSVVIGIWFLVPGYDDVFLWHNVRFGYGWNIFFILLFLYPFFRQLEDIKYDTFADVSFAKCIYGFVSGIFSSLCLESWNVGVFIFCVVYLILNFIIRKKISLFEILFFIGVCIGFSCTLFGVLHSSRVNMVEDFSGISPGFSSPNAFFDRFIKTTLYVFSTFKISFAFLFFFTVEALYEKKYKILLLPLAMVLLGLAMCYVLMYQMVFTGRACSLPCVLFIISILYIFVRLDLEMQVRRWFYIIFISFSCFVFLYSYPKAVVANIRVHNEFTLREKIIAQEISKGNLNVVLDSPAINGYTHHCIYKGWNDISEDKEYWINVLAAQYYGLESICLKE